MEYVLKIGTNHEIEIIEMPKDRDFKWYSRQIGCDWIEIVHPRYFNYPLIVDEEGKLKPNRMNVIASAMYGTWLYPSVEHGEPIVGDVLVVNEGLVDGEPDIIGFTLHQAKNIKERLEKEKNGSVKFKALINGVMI